MFTQKNTCDSSYAKAIIASADMYPDSVATLNKLGISVYHSCKNKFVSPPLDGHADMQLVRLKNNKYLCAPQCYEYYRKLFGKTDCELICGNTYLSSNYPEDIAYNIVVTESYAVHNFKYTDGILKESLNDKIFINVSQGYTACTVCKLPHDSFITSDRGVSKIFEKSGVNFLEITDGDILLPGYDTGFIGGATFMISDDTLAVNGNLNRHRECDRIIDFCYKLEIKVLSLSDNPIMDIGSAVAVI